MTGAQDQAPVPPVTKPVTYEELTPEHKQKYDEVKAQFEADLIGSFERTRNHGIRWKGFSPEGALDNVDLSVPSEERTRALRQEITTWWLTRFIGTQRAWSTSSSTWHIASSRR